MANNSKDTDDVTDNDKPFIQNNIPFETGLNSRQMSFIIHINNNIHFHLPDRILSSNTHNPSTIRMNISMDPNNVQQETEENDNDDNKTDTGLDDDNSDSDDVFLTPPTSDNDEDDDAQ